MPRAARLPAIGPALTLALIVLSAPCFAAAPADGAMPAPAAAPAASTAQLTWLAGCWEKAGRNPVIEEHWMRPDGGMMLGMSRTVRDGRLTTFEQMRIDEQNGRLVLTSKPSKQAEASFASIELTPTKVIFENKEHDFPKRISYERKEDGSLLARIEGLLEGKLYGIDFPMVRASCDSAAPAK